MIEKMADDFIGQMAGERLIDERHKEHYVYAFISLVEKLLTIGTILGIGLWMKVFVPTVFFLIFFLELRKRTGGFHFKCFYQCYLATIITYFMIVICSPIFTRHLKLLFGIFLLAVCVIYFIGTVNHPNIHMDAAELIESKKAARILVLLEGIMICSLFMLGANEILISYALVAVILCASLLGIAKIIKQEVGKNEKN